MIKLHHLILIVAAAVSNQGSVAHAAVLVVSVVPLNGLEDIHRRKHRDKKAITNDKIQFIFYTNWPYKDEYSSLDESNKASSASILGKSTLKHLKSV